MSNILSWFPKRQPTSLICGLDLTYSRATSLLSLAQSLSHSLRSQKSVIQAFQITTGLRTTSALKRIQEQHGQIHKSLSILTAATAASSQLWLHELSDAQNSMQRKVKVCNQASMSSTLGCNEAARIYWPLIAETYDVLLDLLASFEQEISIALENKEAWKSGVRKLMHKVHADTNFRRTSTEQYNKGKAKRVRFDKTVRGKYYHCTDSPCVDMERKEAGKNKHMLCKNKEFFIKLAEDGKESTKRLHKEVRERKKEKKEKEENGDGEDEEEVDFEEIMAEARWWIAG